MVAPRARVSVGARGWAIKVYTFNFDSPDNWTITPIAPPLDSGTNVSGGKLNVGIPITTTVGLSLTTRADSFDAVIGHSYSYEVVIDSFTSANTGNIQFGGQVLWDKAQGAGTFTGSITATDTQELLIAGTTAYFVVDKITISA